MNLFCNILQIFRSFGLFIFQTKLLTWSYLNYKNDPACSFKNKTWNIKIFRFPVHLTQPVNRAECNCRINPLSKPPAAGAFQSAFTKLNAECLRIQLKLQLHFKSFDTSVACRLQLLSETTSQFWPLILSNYLDGKSDTSWMVSLWFRSHHFNCQAISRKQWGGKLMPLEH